MSAPFAKAEPGLTAERSVLLRLENIGRTFQMGEVAVQVLRDINLDIYDGEILAVVGPSGSGKSTILNIVGGLDRPSVGTPLSESNGL